MRYPSLYNQDDQIEDSDYQDLVREEKAQKRYRDALLKHPDPRDPDYPGDINEWRETV